MVEHCSYIYFDENTHETVLLSEETELKRIKSLPKKVFESLCLEHGSTLKGRLTHFRYVMNVTQKPCVLINEPGCILFIPTMSMKSKKCQYVQFNEIQAIKALDNARCQLITKKGTAYDLDVEIRVIRKQMKRSRIYLRKVRERNQKYILMEIKACYNSLGD